MSKTYCSCVGMKGEATRRGGTNGCRASVQAWDGSIIIKNYYDQDNKLRVIVGTSSDSSRSYINKSEFRGTFEEFDQLLQLAVDIKLGKVSVVRHRIKK